MGKKAVKRILLFCFMGIFFYTGINLIQYDKTHAQTGEKRVLFISSYSESFPSVPQQIEGIKSVFNSESIFFDIEYMDTKRFDAQEHEKIFYQMLKYKLHSLITYDLVMVGDDSALEFAMDYQEELFPDTPIVFFAVNDFSRAEKAKERENITGIVEDLSIKENIEMALKFNKKAKKVVAIVDSTITGVGDKQQFYSISEDFPKLKFDDINSSEYTTQELCQVIGQVEKDTILLYLSMNTTKTETFVNIDTAAAVLKEYAKVPVYRAEIGGVGAGILGGKMVSYLETGAMAANIAQKILNGTDPDKIEISYDSPNHYVFDYKIIKQYGLNEKLIPKDAQLLNKEISFYQKYKQVIWFVSGIIFFLLILTIILIVDNILRRKIGKKLQENNERLAKTYEELTSTYEELTASELELREQYNVSQEHLNTIEILNQKYQIAIQSTGSAVWEYDIQNKKITVSKNFYTLIKRSYEDFNDYEDIHDFLEKTLLPEDKERVLQEYNAYRYGGKDEINIQVPVLDSGGGTKWILIRGKGFLRTSGYFRMIHGIILDTTKMKKQENYIVHLANHDYLTTLPNRMAFTNKIKAALIKKEPGAIILMDLDDFKGVNDTLGHIYGDKLLKEIANRLLDLVSETIFVSRFGGDEFLFLITNIENDEEIIQIIENIKRELSKVIVIQDIENHVKFCMGVSKYPEDGEDMNTLLMKADTAMYKAKRDGKNQYMFFRAGMNEELKDKKEIEDAIRDAIQNNKLLLVYQPQVNTVTGEIIGFEALLRMKEGTIPPCKFIPISEDTGLIIELGRWVTKEAIKQLARLREMGYALKPIAINFSNKQLADNDYITNLKELLMEYDIPAKYLEIEITENIFIEKTDKTLGFLDELKKIGVKIALDDFGTGYSSFSYLTYIPVNKIKMDKSLIDKFLSEEDVRVIKCLISLAHSLKLEITAEGVEEPLQYELLKEGGCDYIQGYLFSKPLEVDEMERIYNHNLLEMIEKSH